MITKTATKPDSPIYAQGVESDNRCSSFCAESEVTANTGGAFAVGLTPRIIARFWSRVQRGDGCWLWTAGRSACGYGQFAVGRSLDGKQENRYAHRVVWELTRGPIPDGAVVRHSCDNPPCCNPAHLLIGTQGDNLRDAFARGRMPKERPGRWVVPAGARAAAIAAPRFPKGALAVIAREYGCSLQVLYLIRERALARVNAHV